MSVSLQGNLVKKAHKKHKYTDEEIKHLKKCADPKKGPLYFAENFLDFSFAYIIEACEITQQRFSPELINKLSNLSLLRILFNLLIFLFELSPAIAVFTL